MLCHAADGVEVQPIALIDTVGDVDVDMHPQRTQGLPDEQGGCDAVSVEIRPKSRIRRWNVSGLV